MPHPHTEKPQPRLLVLATVLFYIVAAIAMVLANKWVLNKTTIPLFFLFAQLLIAVVLFMASHLVGIFKLPPKIDIAVCRGLAPLVFLNVLGLSLNNYTLKYVDASFYQVARGLVLPFTVVLSSIMLHTRPSLLILLAIGVVTLGFIIGVGLDLAPGSVITTTSPIGVLLGVGSSMTTALQAVVIKRSMEVVKGNAVEAAWYNNLLSSIAILPLVFAAGEVPDVLTLVFGGGEALTAFFWGSIITGVFGFLLCIAGFLSIKITSPITHMISSAVRGVFQSALSVWIFHDIITSGRATSIGMILAGSIWYTWTKHKEQQAHEQATSGSKLENGGYERVPMKDIGADLQKEEARR